MPSPGFPACKPGRVPSAGRLRQSGVLRRRRLASPTSLPFFAENRAESLAKQQQAVLAMMASRVMSIAEIARQFNVSRSTVCNRQPTG